jgi:ribosomal-protein-serine acetyltransferase
MRNESDQRSVPDAVTTERLILRTPTVESAPDVNEAVRESFTQLHQWMHWATQISTLEETAALLGEARADYLSGSGFSFITHLRADGAFIGIPALFNIDWTVPKLEIGYWLRTGFEGRGLMTEAVRALVDLACQTLEMRRIEIRTDPCNKSSAAIPERLGFVLEGILRSEQRNPQGDLRDTSVYALTHQPHK